MVCAEGLTRRFGARRGVRDVSLRIGAGEVFGFLGPNGAGKTTTIRLLLGLYAPTAGRARVFDRDPWTETVAVHRRVGYLPGELSLYPRLTGRQILDRLARIRGAGERPDRRFRDELAERFSAELDRPVHTLSKGNVQKIGLLNAFAHRPELLVLDEPTAGLDPLLQDEFARLVRETVAQGRTVFLSSHDLDEVQRLVDRVAIIRDGNLVITDTVANLRAAAPKTVRLRFAAPVDPRRFAALDGVEVLGGDGTEIQLSVSGPIGALLRAAAEADAVDLTARPASLDELFRDYYRTGGHR